MKNIRKVFENELREMESSYLRKLFRNIALNFIQNVVQEIEVKLEKLKVKSYHSIKSIPKNIVYQGVASIDELNQCSTDFNLYFEEDLETLSELELFNKGTKELSKGLLYVDSDSIERIIAQKYKGSIIVDGNRHYFSYKLIADNSYYEIEKKLESVFYANNLKWAPLYSPYSSKMFKVVIVDNENCKKYIGKAEEINLENIHRKYKKNFFPIWNIKKETVLSTSDALLRPQGHYEYRIDAGGNNKLLVNLPDVEIIDMKKDRLGDIVVLTYTPNIVSWDLLIINSNYLKLDEYKEFEFQIFNNKENETFVSKLKNISGNRVRTEGEVYRLCSMHNLLEGMEIDEIGVNKQGYIDIKLLFNNVNKIDKEAKVKYFIKLLNMEFWESHFNVEYD